MCIYVYIYKPEICAPVYSICFVCNLYNQFINQLTKFINSAVKYV